MTPASGRTGWAVALAFAGLLVASTATAQEAAGDTARIEWRLTPAETVRYEITSESDLSTVDPSGAPVAGVGVTESVLRLEPRSCDRPPAAACDSVGVSFERKVHTLRLSNAPPMPPLDLARPEDPVTLAQRSDGSWAVMSDGRVIGAGSMVEQLADAIPFSFPAGTVAPGDRWPVALGAMRDNRRFGRIEFSLEGEAVLDSVVGDRAWISVTAADTSESRVWNGGSTVRGSFEWDLTAGELVEGTVERTGTLDQQLPNGETQNSEVRSRVRIRRLPEPETERPGPTS